jgi:putative endonuclease
LGTRGEIAAAEYLRNKKFKILQKNYRCGMGEIDLIAEKGGRIHFIEIKTRSGHGFGAPEEAVDRKKQAKVVKLAEWYLQTMKLRDPRVSLDVLGVTWKENGEPVFRFIEGAFEKEDER